MAVDNWFQSWTPPTNLYADHTAFASPSHPSNFSATTGHTRQSRGKAKTYHGVANMLPYFVSLGLLTPSDKGGLETTSYSHHGYHSNHKPTADDDVTYRDDSYDSNFAETTGPFSTVYHWKQLDYAYDSPEDRESAIFTEDFIQENNLPLGIEVYKDRLFVTMPKWKKGIPVTLAVLPKVARESSPLLVPYPNWEWHDTLSCFGLTSVFRVKADSCGRLWVLDSGQVEVTIKPRQVCNPAVYIFDLQTDKLIHRYELPDKFVKQDGLFSNIMVDIRDGECDNAHAYLTDVWRYGLVVYSLKHERSWWITDHLFYPDPLAAAYNLHGLEFEWVDGIFAMTLSALGGPEEERVLYFHPMSSFREFYVKSSVICNETGWMDVKNAFKLIGESRGPSGHVSSSGIAKNGVMFYNLVTRDSIGCWDTRKPYKRANQGVVAHDSETLIFPNDLKLDGEPRERVWIITNKLPFYLYRKLDPHQINFRIMEAYVDDAIKGSICDPDVGYAFSYDTGSDAVDCY